MASLQQWIKIIGRTRISERFIRSISLLSAEKQTPKNALRYLNRDRYGQGRLNEILLIQK